MCMYDDDKPATREVEVLHGVVVIETSRQIAARILLELYAARMQL